MGEMNEKKAKQKLSERERERGKGKSTLAAICVTYKNNINDKRG